MDFIQKFVNNDALLPVSGFALWKCMSAFWIRQNASRKFEKVGHVSDIVIFPMKGATGNPLKTATCTLLGLESQDFQDRVFMGITKRNGIGEFMNDSIKPRLVLITIQRSGENICLDAPDMPTLVLPADINKNGNIIYCNINRSKNVAAIDCGDIAADWLNKYLQTDDSRIVHYSPTVTERSVYYMHRDFENGSKMDDKVTFSNVTSYTVATTSSLADLNTRLEKPVTMKTFRPNIVVDGPAPYDEDNWEYLKIGDQVVMRCIEPRVVCAVINVDPLTGERIKQREPMVTLDKYRMLPGYGVHGSFGVRVGIDIEGDIKIGDPVYAIRK